MGKLILVLVLIASVPAAAEQKKKPAVPVASNPCAQYGQSFVPVKGTSTCIKATGSLQVDVGIHTGPGRR